MPSSESLSGSKNYNDNLDLEEINGRKLYKKGSKSKRDKSIPLVYTDDEIKNLPYKCKFCPIRFRICSALGGHISKAHPG